MSVEINSRYFIGAKLGSGSFSNVFECTDKETGAKRAMKVNNKTFYKNLKDPLKEANLLKDVCHPAIPKIYESFNNPTEKYSYIIMELCPGISLYSYIVKRSVLGDSTALFITQQLLDVLSYLHQRGVAHLDIKPENIIINTNTHYIKIIDFGLATRNIVKCQEFNGSIHYAAPEVQRNVPFDDVMQIFGR